MRTSLLLLPLLLATSLAAAPATTQATSQRATRRWGQMVEDLRITASTEGAWGKTAASLRIVLENVGNREADLKGAFAWLLIVADKKDASYTEQIPLGSLAQGGALAGEATTEGVFDLAKTKVFAMQDGQAVVDGYPKGDPSAKSTLGELLGPAPLRAQVVVYIPARQALLKSPALALRTGTELTRGFAADEFAAMAAHHEAVKRGKDAVPELLDALNTGKLPAFGQMWIVAALCDIQDDSAVPTLIKTVEKGGPAANVVAYHGPKLKSKTLDDAIIKAAAKDDGVAAWAARGYAVHAGKLRMDLVDAGLKSKDPKARAGLAEGLARDPSKESLAALAKLLRDEDESVRTEAAQWLARSATKSREIRAAMVAALAQPGDSARAALCDALSQLTGHAIPYPAQGTPAEKEAALQSWRDWAAKNDR